MDFLLFDLVFYVLFMGAAAYAFFLIRRIFYKLYGGAYSEILPFYFIGVLFLLLIGILHIAVGLFLPSFYRTADFYMIEDVFEGMSAIFFILAVHKTFIIRFTSSSLTLKFGGG